ncbi:hypothetical protein [Vreelandella aquamarina]|uniref:hypothetical protein n=1 Tax=Vreelandella aquamarina TaxID=77097 RepID=UPI001D1704B5|nr:hypothetical protein [Halomonas axialensis]MCC4290638.1 hypothetical protein [Halomonas axialensis]
MLLDLNTPYTHDDVAELIASKDDSHDRQLRVSNDGIAYLSDDVGADNLDGVLFRLGTWDAGDSHVGDAAAAHQEWVSRIYNALQKHWPKPASTYIDHF